eukprot:4328092-Pleurochrysis_carterae.AAC.3
MCAKEIARMTARQIALASIRVSPRHLSRSHAVLFCCAQADTCGIVLLATLQKSTFRPFLLGRTGIRGQNELFEGERENCSRLFSPGDGGVRDRFGSAGLIVVKPFVALSDLAR